VNADCAGTPNPVCDAAIHQCVQCTAPTDCPLTAPHCIADRCRECAVNTDCTNPADPICSAGKGCVQCVMDTDCPAATPHCNGDVCKN
jgi:hypothetical protein